MVGDGVEVSAVRRLRIVSPDGIASSTKMFVDGQEITPAQLPTRILIEVGDVNMAWCDASVVELDVEAEIQDTPELTPDALESIRRLVDRALGDLHGRLGEIERMIREKNP